MVVSYFQIGTVPKSHYLKSGKFCTWRFLHIFLSSHGNFSSVLTYKVIALPIAIPLSHKFYLPFAASKNLFITWANFEDRIIMFGRLQCFAQKRQPLNINIWIPEYQCELWNFKMSTVEHKYELLNIVVNLEWHYIIVEY